MTLDLPKLFPCDHQRHDAEGFGEHDVEGVGPCQGEPCPGYSLPALLQAVEALVEAYRTMNDDYFATVDDEWGCCHEVGDAGPECSGYERYLSDLAALAPFQPREESKDE